MMQDILSNTTDPPTRGKGTKKRRDPPDRRKLADIPVGAPDEVRHFIGRLPMLKRAIYELSELDPSLLQPRERERLRLLVHRVIGHVETRAVGDAINELHLLRRRGFPLIAVDHPDAPRQSRDVARTVIGNLRSQWKRACAKPMDEALWLETTLDFLERKSHT